MKRPVLIKNLVERRIEQRLLTHCPFHHAAQMPEISLATLDIFEVVACNTGLELRQHITHIGCGQIHLVKRLHGAKPCGRAGKGRLARRCHGSGSHFQSAVWTA